LYFDDYQQQGKQDSLNLAFSFYNSVFENASSDFYHTLGLIGRAACYEQKQNYPKALEDYQLVATRYASQGFVPLALKQMAIIKENSNDDKAAIELYQRIVKEYPDSVNTKFARARVYFLSDPANKRTITNNTSTNGNVPLILNPQQ
jgi:tetratricopeptide (TPR) repeat protein